MLLSLSAPVTGFQLLVVAVVVLLAAFFFFVIMPRRSPVRFGQEPELVSNFKWLRKSALPILALVFLLIYPFSQPFIHWATNLIYGVPDVAHAGNATGAEIAADQLAGGGVQLGTFFTKLWITIVFYILFSFLPFLVQGLTHPAPTAWAKGGTAADGTPYGYSNDFNSLNAYAKFTVYGRIQFVNTAKIIGAALAAALLV